MWGWVTLVNVADVDSILDRHEFFKLGGDLDARMPLWGFIGDVVTNLVDGRNVTNYHLFTGTKPKTLNPKP